MPISLSNPNYAGVQKVDTPRSLRALEACGITPESLLKLKPEDFAIPGSKHLSDGEKDRLRKFKAQRYESKRQALLKEAQVQYRKLQKQRRPASAAHAGAESVGSTGNK